MFYDKTTITKFVNKKAIARKMIDFTPEMNLDFPREW